MSAPIIGHPFLQSANLDYEYRPVTKSVGLPEVISADTGTGDTPDDTLLRRSHISLDGSSYTLFYRIIPANRKDGSPYLDQFGRHIMRSEGIVVKGDWDTIPIRQKHVKEIHDLLTPCFEEFWTQTKLQYGKQPPLLEVKETVSITPEDAKAEDCITQFVDMPRFNARPTSSRFVTETHPHPGLMNTPEKYETSESMILDAKLKSSNPNLVSVSRSHGEGLFFVSVTDGVVVWRTSEGAKHDMVPKPLYTPASAWNRYQSRVTRVHGAAAVFVSRNSFIFLSEQGSYWCIPELPVWQKKLIPVSATSVVIPKIRGALQAIASIPESLPSSAIAWVDNDGTVGFALADSASRSLKTIQSSQRLDDVPTALAISPLLCAVVATPRQIAVLWERAKGALDCFPQDVAVTSLAFSSDGKRLAAGRADGSITFHRPDRLGADPLWQETARAPVAVAAIEALPSGTWLAVWRDGTYAEVGKRATP